MPSVSDVTNEASNESEWKWLIGLPKPRRNGDRDVSEFLLTRSFSIASTHLKQKHPEWHTLPLRAVPFPTRTYSRAFPATIRSVTLARPQLQRDTFLMRVPAKLAFFCAALCFTAASAFSDEIRLKDGKKLYGVIVAYEDNMFRIKTDFGFVLVEKDKIASIIPTTPAPSTAAPASASANSAKPARAPEKKQLPVPSTTSSGNSTPAGNSTATETSDPPPAKPKLSAEPVRPELPATSRTAKVTPPALKPATPPEPSAITAAQPLSVAKQPQPPANKEQVQGTLYTNFSHGFKMYKAPSWEIIEDARKALPNAIVAMGTSNESTLMVVGQEETKDSLDVSANGVEKRLREIYTNYHMVSRRKTVVGGAPAVEFKYTGLADEHQWSGTLVVVTRGNSVLTILGMTYADNDLIQIQENVIARAISSTDFNVH